MEKKLFRSSVDSKICGVLGGLAEYLDVDSTLVRIAYIALCVFSAGFPGLLLYILMAIVMPKRNDYNRLP